MRRSPPPAGRSRALLAVLSVAVGMVAYGLLSTGSRYIDRAHFPEPIRHVLRPSVLPPPQDLVDTVIQLVQGRTVSIGDPRHASSHLDTLALAHVTLQGSLFVSTLRVLIGLSLGVPMGIAVGLALGWNQTLDAYGHPVYIVFRSIPPLALISYAMLWLGHTETHVLLPIVYGVSAAMVIPIYHGIRDVAGIYVLAARTLGAPRALFFSRVILPSVGPSIISGVRYALVIAWMTTVGAEMLMARTGMGVLLVGGGIWSSRSEIGVDPAVVIVGILSLSTAAFAMDAVIRLASRLPVVGWANR
ncbi:MAG TPA: ABC transporter permease subunit [bacterium]|nr:ABC transporter permease subunit [bacterium]